MARFIVSYALVLMHASQILPSSSRNINLLMLRTLVPQAYHWRQREPSQPTILICGVAESVTVD